MSAKEMRKYIKLYHGEFRLDTRKISMYKNQKLRDIVLGLENYILIWVYNFLAKTYAFTCIQSLGCIQLFCEPMNCSLPGSPVHWDSPARTLEWVARALLKGIFPTQGSKLLLLHCRQILYHWATREAPRCMAYTVFSYETLWNICSLHKAWKHRKIINQKITFNIILLRY